MMSTYQILQLPPRERGFSLLEMLIVLCLLATVASIAAPVATRSTEAAALHSSARQLVAHLNLVRATALQRGDTAVMEIDPRRRRYMAPGAISPQGLARGVELARELSGVMSRDPFIVRYHSDGRGDNTAIVLAGSRQGRVRISIDPVTGFASARAR